MPEEEIPIMPEEETGLIPWRIEFNLPNIEPLASDKKVGSLIQQLYSAVRETTGYERMGWQEGRTDA